MQGMPTTHFCADTALQIQAGAYYPMADIVRNFYAGFGEREWGRLDRPDDGQLEFAITTAMLTRHLPARARVLDDGGGPGRYSLWLAERGYRVSLADLWPELLAIGRAHIAASPVAAQIEEVVEADARDLSRWSDASFGAVLALGPLYHLTAPAGHDAAARRSRRRESTHTAASFRRPGATPQGCGCVSGGAGAATSCRPHAAARRASIIGQISRR